LQGIEEGKIRAERECTQTMQSMQKGGKTNYRRQIIPKKEKKKNHEWIISNILLQWAGPPGL
jgi:hypothetical protein